MPIYFPKVDYDGGKIAGGDQEVIIPMAGVAGASVIITPNSMTLKDKVAYQYFYVGSEGKIVPRANVDSSQSVAVEVLHNPLVLSKLVEGL